MDTKIDRSFSHIHVDNSILGLTDRRRHNNTLGCTHSAARTDIIALVRLEQSSGKESRTVGSEQSAGKLWRTSAWNNQRVSCGQRRRLEQSAAAGNGWLGTISGESFDGAIFGETFDGWSSRDSLGKCLARLVGLEQSAGKRLMVAWNNQRGNGGGGCRGETAAPAPAPSMLVNNCADCEGVRHHVMLGAGKFCCPASPAWCRVPAPTREPYNYLRHTTTNTFNLCFSSCFVLRPLVQCLHLQV